MRWIRRLKPLGTRVDEVVKFSPRVVLEDVEVNKAPLSEIVPDVMTDAKLREAEASNLSRLIAQPGRTRRDGRGLVTGRVRARGDGMGRFRGDGQGGGDGLLGGGGSSGIADRLGIIDFLDEFGGPQRCRLLSGYFGKYAGCWIEKTVSCSQLSQRFCFDAW